MTEFKEFGKEELITGRVYGGFDSSLEQKAFDGIAAEWNMRVGEEEENEWP